MASNFKKPDIGNIDVNDLLADLIQSMQDRIDKSGEETFTRMQLETALGSMWADSVMLHMGWHPHDENGELAKTWTDANMNILTTFVHYLELQFGLSRQRLMHIASEHIKEIAGADKVREWTKSMVPNYDELNDNWKQVIQSVEKAMADESAEGLDALIKEAKGDLDRVAGGRAERQAEADADIQFTNPREGKGKWTVKPEE